MRAHPFMAMAILLNSCTSPEQLQRDRLTDRIEAHVKLPEVGLRLDNYARYYAFNKSGLIVGVYIPGYRPPNPEWKCEELLEDLSSHEVPCPLEKRGDRALAGQRVWVDGEDKLPRIMDGGCAVVTIIYDPKADQVKDTFCNGLA